ncbi:MAG: MotA/TolQ/ExbB proton channel family protein [Sutterellaceae bacterium]|nr:MotA/TolQ/ExbB proton channel family protein [Sutterellaceae bacterium]
MNKFFVRALVSGAVCFVMHSVSAAPLDQVLSDVQRLTQRSVQQAAAEVGLVKKAQVREDQLKDAAQQRLEELRKRAEGLETELIKAGEELTQERRRYDDEKKTLDGVFESIDRHETLLRELAAPHGLADVGLDRIDSKRTASLERLEGLWLAASSQIAATAQSDKVTRDVFNVDGTQFQSEVVRHGPFTASLTDGRWVNFLPAQKAWQVLARQPDPAASGTSVIDPTMGVALSQAADRNSVWNHIKPAGIIGVFIAVVAVIALGLGLLRYTRLTLQARRITEQKKHLDQPSQDNALGRVLAAGNAAAGAGKEAQETALEAAVTEELPALTRGLGTLAVLAGIPTLLGLLGTVSGMIETFTVMSRYGNNQPDLLAGGIAEALVTTELGLIAAIPILLLHCAVKNKAKDISDVLEEEAAGLAALTAAGQKAVTAEAV